GGLTRREVEDRMALNQMRYYMENLENRVSQLTNELQFQQSPQRLERQREQAIEQTSPAPMPAIQEASSKVATAERAPTMDSSLPRINGFLWFMLLCSIGINLYLAWISRGFYMRYAELADELRETFTSSNT
ncbi:MAG TPA: hypothetical protein PKD54_16225, partial [Pirellulaceae bacterium]|nr:hypothetical protein [Pirellulaceae bacterium]